MSDATFGKSGICEYQVPLLPKVATRTDSAPRSSGGWQSMNGRVGFSFFVRTGATFAKGGNRDSQVPLRLVSLCVGGVARHEP